ncbi:MAG: ribonuclease E inhibitor RraB [Gaiellaceae bacterium]
MGFLDRIRNQGAPSTPQETDQLVLRQLTARGADLTKPRHVIHYLYFTEETDARTAAEVIERAEWETTLNPPDEKIVEWSLRSEGYRVIGPATVGAFRAWFEQIAAEYEAEYDGWEASAKP